MATDFLTRQEISPSEKKKMSARNYDILLLGLDIEVFCVYGLVSHQTLISWVSPPIRDTAWSKFSWFNLRSESL